jgi:hypothetical protein
MHGPAFPFALRERPSKRPKHGGGRAEGATLAELARSYHVGKSTISRLIVVLEATRHEVVRRQKISHRMCFNCCYRSCWVDIREFVNSITGIPNNSGVVTQGQTGNNFIIAHPAPQQSELETSRRKSVVAKLRQEYVFSHDGLSPALLAGTEPVPPDWMNKRLEQMGESWRVRVRGIEYEIFPVN